jgi:hypothetical protein
MDKLESFPCSINSKNIFYLEVLYKNSYKDSYSITVTIMDRKAKSLLKSIKIKNRYWNETFCKSLYCYNVYRYSSKEWWYWIRVLNI